MFFRQYDLGCLSLFSYLVGDRSTGRAVVVDPRRDVSQYLADADAGLGDVVLEVRATPGHTPESVSIVIWEHAADEAPWGVLTGDTLFIGDVGRPDLLASSGWTADALARRLYRSLHEQLLTLPDGTQVFPAHGAGSACGRHMSSASTIGEQRIANHALAPAGEDAFVDAVLGGQLAVPPYFPSAAAANRSAHGLLDDSERPPVLGVGRVLELQAAGAAGVDGRSPEVFASGHLRG